MAKVAPTRPDSAPLTSRRRFLFGGAALAAGGILAACVPPGLTRPVAPLGPGPILRPGPRLPTPGQKARVAVLRCDPRSDDRAIAEAISRAADLVGGVDRLFAGKKKVVVKPNLGYRDVRTHLGRQVALTDPSVLRGTVALIRKHFAGEIVVGDATTGSGFHDLYHEAGNALDELKVRLVDLKDGPFVELRLPTGLMFTRYFVSRELADADLVVSVAKLKAHTSAGVTLALKNLFGLLPTQQYGSPRLYLHAPVRLPRVLADFAQLFPPALCVVDGLVGQNGKEWNGQPTEPGVIVLGTNVVATDATAARLLGVDPEADFPAFPYYFDRNPLVLAAPAGLGSPAAADVEVVGDVPTQPLLKLSLDRSASRQDQATRQAVAAEVDTYLRERARLLQTDRNRYVALASGRVVKLADSVDALGSTASAPGVLVKRILPPEEEDERLDVYAAI